MVPVPVLLIVLLLTVILQSIVLIRPFFNSNQLNSSLKSSTKADMPEQLSEAVQCSILDTSWENVIAEPALPAEEGAKITLKCPVSIMCRREILSTTVVVPF